METGRPAAMAVSIAHWRLRVSSAPVGRTSMTSPLRDTDRPQDAIRRSELSDVGVGAVAEPQATQSRVTTLIKARMIPSDPAVGRTAVRRPLTENDSRRETGRSSYRTREA